MVYNAFNDCPACQPEQSPVVLFTERRHPATSCDARAIAGGAAA
jgi:hypothetical protein